MTVKLLRSLLDAITQTDDHIEVSVLCTAWPGRVLCENPPQPQFRIATVAISLDPDTAEDRIVLECDQDF